MTVIHDPFVGPPPPEVPLTNAPLVRVIAQIRFPLIVTIEQRDFIGPFQEAIRKQYPILRQEQTQGMFFSPNRFAPTTPHTAWRFSDLEDSWRVSLSSDFLALDTGSYTSRSDFFQRFEHVLAALNDHVQPGVIDRLGVRYIDRVMGEQLNNIKNLIRTEMSGILGSTHTKYVQSALTEALFTLDEAQILARWGYLPAGATTDPSAIVPAEKPSWILDMDMSRTKQRQFDAGQIVHEANEFAERIYSLFRWAVTPEFLRIYGGKP